MQLTITMDQLKKMGACESGVEELKQVLGGAESWSTEWTRDRQIELLKTPIGKHIGWACRMGLLPMWSMDRARLDGARLDGASLDGASLVGASLVGARLDGARLDGASLVGARLDGASLVGARLDGARLVCARLVGASLVGASLVGASLVGACLNGACLNSANFAGAKICPCGEAVCSRLQQILDDAGWVIGANGLLKRKGAPVAMQEAKP